MQKFRLKLQETKKSFSILFSHIAEYKNEILFLAVLGIISALANGTVPYIVGSFLDALLNISETWQIGNIRLPVWTILLISWIIIQFFTNIIDWIVEKKGRFLSTKAQFDYQSKALIHLLYLPLNFHKNEKIGEVSENISRAAWRLSHITENLLINLTPPLLSVFVGILITAFIHPIFPLILLSGVLVYLVVLFKLIMPTSHLLDEGNTAWNQAFGDSFQSISAIESVKHMSTEDYENKRIKERFGMAQNIWNTLESLWSNVNFYQRITILFTQATIFLVSVYFIQNGVLTIGELVALNSYATLLFGPFILLGQSWQSFQTGLVSIRQAEEKIFSVKTEPYHPKNAYTPSHVEGSVRFENVSFGYEKKGMTLKDLNFEVKPGERVALVGKSGVGKSTAINLISGYYFPKKGKVLIDDQPTKRFDLMALRKHIAIVSQEPVLFNDTILMNIRYGNLEATDEEVIAAAKKAYAHEFIEAMPNKYEQLVGERGVKLSVGQKQRVAIARAILRDPSILILDEPTSALDAETEKHITESFEELMEGKTTFIVAHRLSTVRKADRIFVFDKGRIVEEGTHKKLIKKKSGIYKNLHAYQAGLHGEKASKPAN